jgi:hypothetical protein
MPLKDSNDDYARSNTSQTPTTIITNYKNTKTNEIQKGFAHFRLVSQDHANEAFSWQINGMLPK